MSYGFEGNNGLEQGGFGALGTTSISRYWIGHNYDNYVVGITSGSDNVVNITGKCCDIY